MDREIYQLLMSHRAETCLECTTQPNAFQLLRRSRRAPEMTPLASGVLPAAARNNLPNGHGGSRAAAASFWSQVNDRMAEMRQADDRVARLAATRQRAAIRVAQAG